MSKVQEKELNNYIETFNAKNIDIIIEGTFKQTTKLELAECTYNTTDGKLKLQDNNSIFEIDISFVDLIEINEKQDTIKIHLENYIDITIAK